jgi:hypothetical protein
VSLGENPAAISTPFCSGSSVHPCFPSPKRQQPGLIFLSSPAGFVVLLAVAVAGFLFDLLFVLLAAAHVPSIVLGQDSLGRRISVWFQSRFFISHYQCRSSLVFSVEFNPRCSSSATTSAGPSCFSRRLVSYATIGFWSCWICFLPRSISLWWSSPTAASLRGWGFLRRRSKLICSSMTQCPVLFGVLGV